MDGKRQVKRATPAEQKHKKLKWKTSQGCPLRAAFEANASDGNHVLVNRHGSARME
jgi:hypothetical protein